MHGFGEIGHDLAGFSAVMIEAAQTIKGRCGVTPEDRFGQIKNPRPVG